LSIDILVKQLAKFVVHFSIVHHYCQHWANSASV